MARQTKTKSERSAKECSLCGARMWMWDTVAMKWSGPWHFNWCSEAVGGDDKRVADIEHDMRYAEEQFVSREQGARVLKAIGRMMDKRNTPEQMAKIKAAIQGEIKKL